MSEYLVEEVRAMASDLRGAPGTSMIGTHISLPTARAVAIYEALCAFAERIEADESAVPVAWISHFHIVGLPEKDYYGKLPIQSLQPGVYSHTPLFTHPPAQAEQVEDDAEARSHARMIHDFPRLSAFFQKHALGSKLPASCFACGHVGERAITHAELADIYVCKTCAEKIAKSPAKSADASAHPTTNSPETDSKLVDGAVAQGESVAWQIDTDDEVERVAKAAGWDNRRYMTPADYAIWCNRMREFVRIAVDVPKPFLAAQPRAVPDVAMAVLRDLNRAISTNASGAGIDHDKRPTDYKAGMVKAYEHCLDLVRSRITARAALNRTAAAQSPGESNNKPIDCSGDPSSCPDNEGRGCYCSDLHRKGESA